VQGSIVELGYGYGESFSILSFLAEKNDCFIYGYDSFAGFPSPNDLDFSSRRPRKGEWSHRTLNEALLQLAEFGISQSFINQKVKLIPGYVENTLLVQKPDDKIKFLRVDLDLYAGYRAALENLWGLISDGGFVLFDEYGEKNGLAQQRR
jgi:hypothetical protein